MITAHPRGLRPLSTLAATLLLLRGLAPARSAPAAGPGLAVPAGYRTGYTYLGTWAVAADGKPGSKEMHIVYASPGAVAGYRKAGRMPAGTVMVKEVYEAATGDMTTGTVSRAAKLKGWFVMRKPLPGENHAGDKRWGRGWGWAWFDAATPQRTATRDYEQDCLGCHLPAEKTDWLYAQGYPVLRAR